MTDASRPLLILHGAIKTPPFSAAARVEAGTLLRRVQDGEVLSLPQSRPMPSIGAGCHELRVKDQGHEWRIVYRADSDFILIVDVFAKTTRQTPLNIIQTCKQRLSRYALLQATLKKGI